MAVWFKLRMVSFLGDLIAGPFIDSNGGAVTLPVLQMDDLKSSLVRNLAECTLFTMMEFMSHWGTKLWNSDRVFAGRMIFVLSRAVF